MKNRLFTLLGLAILILGCVHLQAQTTELTLSDGIGDSVTIDQNGNVTHTGSVTVIGASGSGPHGDITFVGSVGSFSLNITNGEGGGFETLPTLMNVGSSDVNAGAAGTLTITFSDTDYTDLGSVLDLSSSGTITADTAAGTTVTFAGLDDSTNAIPAGSPIGALGPFTQAAFGTPTSVAGTADFANPIGSSGSLSEVVTLAFTGAGEIDSGFTISNVVPEPTSVVLLGSILLGLAGIMRKRIKRA